MEAAWRPGNFARHCVVVLALLALAGCTHKVAWINNMQLKAQLLEAEREATPNGRQVLVTGRQMTLDKGEVIRGACWDYANEVYNRAGFPNTRYSRATVFLGSLKHGPYADPKLIEPGDFLYYINHSYHNIEHSAIFVKWLNFDRKVGLMLSYAGEKRRVPAEYQPYDLSHVFRIIRPNTH